MKWLLIVTIYAACSDPVMKPTGQMFDTKAECVEWVKTHAPQLGLTPGSLADCVPLIQASK